MPDTTTAPGIPIGLRHTSEPNTVDVDPGRHWDAELQVNLDCDGRLWARNAPMAATVTSTNLDGASDDTSDPYR
jgi:hypothetical protein